MGADIKALRNRIKSVDSTLHLTKAMGLVASSKIRRATDAMLKSREYAGALESVVTALTACRECETSPYLKKRDGARTRILVIMGDRGMAGGYNANIARLAAEYPDADFYPIGKRALDRFGHRAEAIPSSEHVSDDEIASLAHLLCEDFKTGQYDRLGLMSTEYVSMLTQTAKIDWILPLSRNEDTGDVGILFEPDETSILNAVIPTYVGGRIFAAIRDSFASEVAARRAAMDSAGKNAQTMIDDLQLKYNRARQSAITQEITEIVAGAGD